MGAAATWLTTAQAAEALRFTDCTIMDMCKRGDIKGAEKVRGIWRIPAASVLPHFDVGASVAQAANMAARWKAEGRPGWAPERRKSLVYIVRAGANGPVKIGFTLGLKRRLELLQLGNHQKLKCLLVIDGDVSVERELHERFQSSHIRGEWFRYTAELRAFVRAAKGRAVSNG